MKIKRRYTAFVWLLFILLPASNLTGQALTIKDWQDDLNYVVDKIRQLHPNPYHKISKEDFEKEVSKASAMIFRGNQEATHLSLVRLLASVGDSHTSWMHWNDQGSQLPVIFNYYDDGLYVVGTSEKYSRLLGARVEKIANMPLKAIDSLIAPLVAGENQVIDRWIIPQYLRLGVVLRGLGLTTKESLQITYQLNGESSTASIKLQSEDINFAQLTPGESMWLSNPQSAFWYKVLPDQQMLYINYSQSTEFTRGPTGPQTMDLFSSEITRVLSENPPIEKIFLDLRRNTGGESANNYPLIQAILSSPLAHSKGTLFVGMARETFSDTPSSASVRLCLFNNKNIQ